MKKLITLLLALCLIFIIATPAYAANTATATRRDSTLHFEGRRIEFHTFDLGGQNHVRLRDLALMLYGTSNQFDVAWNAADRAVQLKSGAPYTRVGGEWSPMRAATKTGTLTTAGIFLDGREVSLSALRIGGETFIRLRDISDALGFQVRWSAPNSSIIIETSDRQIRYSISASQGPGSTIRVIDPSRPTIALTFDDGPGTHTETVLDILEEHGVPATFFVIGSSIQNRKSTLTRTFRLGHEIANHSWSHARLPSVSTSRIRTELESTNRQIESVTGVAPTLFRAPFGAVDSRVKDVARSLGMPIIGWSLDTRDWELRNARAIYDSIMQTVQDRDIILCHDIHRTTAEAMGLVIPSLLAQGFQFVTVSELMCFFGVELQPGVEFHHG
ncbi:MAG: polysaccharide deacetylase family protein [Oscillospiraceae bacterium]|nr:polysaccharide deacetylase family protein [Oscillospiraceae bacterium]